jgi:transmembrane sensor
MQADKQTESVGRIADIAGAWLLRRHDGLALEEEEEFRQWLSADIRHVDAFAELERTWRELNQPRERGLSSVAIEGLARRRKRRMWQRSIFALGIAGATAVWVFGLLRSPLPSIEPGLSPTIAVAPDRQVLTDGSTIELNAGSDFAVAFSSEERVVRLMRGEALFTVVKDVARPFVVIAGAVEIRAVGTEFSVRHALSEIDVLVTEGSVAVERMANSITAATVNGSSAEPIILEVGRRIVIPGMFPAGAPLQIKTATPAEIERALAWRSRRIAFSATPLADVLALFNRHNELQLVTPDAATGQLEISGIFWADDPEGFVRLIETGLQLQTERDGKTIVLRRK